MGLALSRGCAIVSLGFAHRGFAAMGLGFCLPWVPFFFFFFFFFSFVVWVLLSLDGQNWE